ncbi:MAG: hypothetical protein ACLR7F_11165 [Waltera sp.]
MDMAEKLTFIDEHYLSAYDALKVDSEVTEGGFRQARSYCQRLSHRRGRGRRENTYLSQNFYVGDSLDRSSTLHFRSWTMRCAPLPEHP